LKGFVIDSTRSPISSVNIKLTELSDTSKTIDFTTSNEEGMFSLKCQNKGKYILSLYHLSYLKKVITLNIFQDTFINIVLNRSNKNLPEIDIKSNNTYFGDDKVVHIITKADIQQSINSLYMLEIFPQIEIDPRTQKITTKDKKKIKVLINGISADQYQIQAIKKEEVLKIEYQYIASSRYRGYDSVINVITKNEFRGISFSLFGSKSINKGYGYGNTSIKYSRKNSLFGIFYNNNIGDYKNLIINEKLSYLHDSIQYNKEKTGIKSPNNFGHHNFTLKYIYYKKDKLDIVFNITPNFYNSYSERNQNTSVVKNNVLVENGFQKRTESKAKKFNTINFYLHRHLKRRQELIFDLSYNYFNYHYSLLTYETQNDSSKVFSDIYSTKNIKNSVISELFYSKSFKSIRLNTDLRYSYSKLKQIINSTLSFPIMQILNGYIELERKHSKFYYKSNIGFSFYDFRNENLNTKSDKISLQYLASINYSLSSNNKISLKYNLSSNNPSLSQLNGSTYQLDEVLFKHGNPALKPYLVHQLALNHYFYKKFISLYSTLEYVYFPDKINEYYYKNSNGITKSYSNIDWERYGAYSLNINYYPFPNKWLKLGLYFKIDYSKIFFREKTNSRFGYYFQPSLQIYNKKFLFQYTFYATRKYLGDNSTYILPQHSYFALGYQHKNLAISIDGYYPFSKAWRSIYKTIPQSLVQSQRESVFYDNGQMFSLRINCFFSKGKIVKPQKKKLQNTDNDTGVLEEKEK